MFCSNLKPVKSDFNPFKICLGLCELFSFQSSLILKIRSDKGWQFIGSLTSCPVVTDQLSIGMQLEPDLEF